MRLLEILINNMLFLYLSRNINDDNFSDVNSGESTNFSDVNDATSTERRDATFNASAMGVHKWNWCKLKLYFRYLVHLTENKTKMTPSRNYAIILQKDNYERIK